MPPASWECLEWLESVLINYQSNSKMLTVTKIESDQATNAGDNYTSLMLRIRYSGQIGSGESTSRKVIVKKKLHVGDTAALLNKVFLLEANIYKFILEKYSEMVRGTPLSGQDMWAHFYYGSIDAIVMEDLKELGYQLADRKKGLTLEEALLAMKSLGRFHGLSVVAIEKGLVNPQILGRFGLVDHTTKDFFKTLLLALAMAIEKSWGPEWTQAAKKMRELKDVLMQRLSRKYDEDRPLNVICHGDCWTNNMMFKYEEDGTPKCIKFVDFQLPHYNSFAWDINYVLHSSVRRDIRNPNYSTFLQTYRDSMQETFHILGHDTEAPSVEIVRAECHRLRLFKFIIEVISNPIMVCDAKDVVGIDDMLTNPEKTVPIYSNPSYVEYIKPEIEKYMNDKTIATE